jgi:hypothetical protein
MMSYKQAVRRNEMETEKLLGLNAAQRNDEVLEKSRKDYEQLVLSKE